VRYPCTNVLTGSPGPMQPSDGWPPSPGWRSPALPDPAVQWSPSGTGTTGPGGTGSAEDGNTGSTLRPQTPQVIQLDTAASAAMATGPRPNTASPRTDGWGSLQSFGPRAGTPSRGGRPRTGNQGWMDFRPTRAHALLVFQVGGCEKRGGGGPEGRRLIGCVRDPGLQAGG
jgi:hypothetical protein